MFYEVGKCAEKCLNAAAKHGEVIIITNSDDGWVKFSAERFVPKLLPCLEQFRIISARTRYERFYPNQPLCWKAAAFAHEVNEIYSASNKMERKKLVNPVEDDAASFLSKEDWESTANTSLSSLTDDFASVIPSRRSQPNFIRRSKKTMPQPLPSFSKKEVISFGDSMEERTAVKIVANQLKATPKSVMFINNPSPIQLIGQLNMLTSNMDFVCGNDASLDLEISPRQAIRAAEAFLYDHGDNKSSLPVKNSKLEKSAFPPLRNRTNDIRIASNQPLP